MEKKLETGYVDEKKQEKTRKRVATFKDQVEKGVKDMKVSQLGSTRNAVLYQTVPALPYQYVPETMCTGWLF